MLPYYNSPDFNPVFIKNSAQLEKTITHKIEDFAFTDNNGNSFGSKDLKKIHVANFIFTSCTHICPKMTTNWWLKIVSKQPKCKFGFTVTPWLDSPEVLNRYKKEFTLNSENWHFLTGDKNKIYSL